MNQVQKLYNSDFWKLTSANFLMATAFYFLVSGLPVYFKEMLNLKDDMIGLLSGSATFAAVLIRPFVGYSLDTYGRKWIYLIAFILFSLTFLSYPFAVTISLILVVRLLHGFIWGTITVSNSTIVIDLIPANRRGEGIGVFGLSMTLAMAIGPFIAMTIFKKFDFNTMFVSGAILSFLGLFVAFLVKYPVFSNKNQGKKMQLEKLYDKTAFPISVGLMILLIPYGGMMTFTPIYIAQNHIGNTGLFFLVLAIFIGISRLVTGKIFDKQGPNAIIFYSAILFFIGFLLIANLKTSVGLYVAAALLGFGNGIVFPSFQAMVNNIIPVSRRGAGNSTLLTFLDFGIGGGMIILGFVSTKYNLTLVYNLSAIISLAGYAYYWFVIRNYYKHKKEVFDSIQK